MLPLGFGVTLMSISQCGGSKVSSGVFFFFLKSGVARGHTFTHNPLCVVLQLVEQLSPLDVFLGLMAAAAHDVDHPGVNQPFLIKTQHHLASLYQVLMWGEEREGEGGQTSRLQTDCFCRLSFWHVDSEPDESCAEHLRAGEPPLEVHCGHAARVGAAVAPACRHVVSARTHRHTPAHARSLTKASSRRIWTANVWRFSGLYAFVHHLKNIQYNILLWTMILVGGQNLLLLLIYFFFTFFQNGYWAKHFWLGGGGGCWSDTSD